ncbi:MAG: hypothetical protein K0S70_3893 [Microbacterium sp.]|nr:hypothetical protein [Microbacterium sp.]
MFALVSSASIACGGHAGDAASMRAAVAGAAAARVAVGAHPSYLDRAGFGRVRVAVEPDVLRLQVVAQLRALVAAGGDIRYVKPHGALYHAATEDAATARAVAAAVADLSAALGRAIPVLGLGGAIASAASDAGLPLPSPSGPSASRPRGSWSPSRARPFAPTRCRSACTAIRPAPSRWLARCGTHSMPRGSRCARRGDRRARLAGRSIETGPPSARPARDAGMRMLPMGPDAVLVEVSDLVEVMAIPSCCPSPRPAPGSRPLRRQRHRRHPPPRP